MTVELFTASDGSQTDLWAFDTTTGATTLMKTGLATNSPLTVLNSVAYFEGISSSGSQLWRSDGTVAGTYALGAVSSGIGIQPVSFNGYVYFDSGNALARTDGTAAGTVGIISLAGIAQLNVVNGKLVFVASDSAHGSELWVSDGTAAGTHLLDDIFPGQAGSTISMFGSAGNHLFFMANENNATQGSPIFVTDGTAAGTVKIGFSTTYPCAVAYNGELYFSGSNSSGTGLFASDGTTSGTTLVQNGLPIEKLFVLDSHLVVAALGSNGHNLYLSDGTAAGTVLSTTLPTSANLSNAVVAGDKLYFVASDAAHGSELYVTDGTTAGTSMIKDIDPGADSGVSSSVTLSVVGSSVIFAANDGVHGLEPWITNGTAAGTHLVADINNTFNDAPSLNPGTVVAAGSLGYFIAPGATSAIPQLYVTDGAPSGTHQLGSFGGASGVTGLRALGSKLIFTASSGASADPQIYVTNGSTIVQLFGASNVTINSSTVFHSELFFGGTVNGVTGLYATDGTPGNLSLISSHRVSALYNLGSKLVFEDSNQYYVSDGTGAGTVPLNTFIPAVKQAATLVSNGKLYVLIQSGGLFVTDGTAMGSSQLTDGLTTGPTSFDASSLAALGGGVVFQANDKVHGAEVWISDGTVAGTHLLSDVNPTKDASASLNPSAVVQAGGLEYFTGTDPVFGTELFVSDGTTMGTHLVADLAFGSASSAPSNLLVFGSKIAFTANDGVHGTQIYVTDGTVAGIIAVTSTAVGAPTGGFTTFNSKLYFATPTGLASADGTAGGETIIKGGLQIASTTIGGSSFYQANGKLFFEAAGSDGGGLYVSDGTNAGTFLAASMSPTSLISAMTVGSDLFFGTYDSANGTRLWASDGTVGGSQVLHSFGNTSQFAGVSYLTPLGSKLVFSAIDAAHGAELWISDGTVAGTVLLDDINPGVANGAPSPGNANYSDPFVRIGSELFFVADDGVHGSEVWKTDGTTAGTVMIKDINPTGYANPGWLTAFNGRLYFTANDGNRAALWQTDGTTVGTTTISAPDNGDNAAGMIVVGSKMFYIGTDTIHTGRDLFVTDGTTAGTQFLDAVFPTAMMGVGNTLFFTAYDATNGSELWKSDGTVGGTVRVTDTGYANNSTPSQFTIVNGKIFFSADDGVHGSELFVSDGVNTNLVADINPGAASSGPSALTVADNKLFFAAVDPAGTGMWVSDGTGMGTTRLFEATGSYTAISNVQAVGSEVFFYASGSAAQAGLYVTDGSAAGTIQLTSEVVSNISMVGSRVYFNGFDAAHGTELWTSDGTIAGTYAVTRTGAANGSNPTGYTALATPGTLGDFNGDGHSDLLFQAVNGASFTAWQVFGATALHSTSNTFVSSIDPAYQSQGVADFDGDGRSDLVWRDGATGAFSIWSASSTGFTPNTYTNATVDSGWQMAGFGDFGGDGRDDILWRNMATGTFSIWTSTGSGFAQNTYFNGTVDTSWHVQAVGDFNGDGRDDILWRNSSGVVTEWQSNGVGFDANTYVDGSVDTTWHIAAVADFNGDGKADLIWRNAATGVFSEWQSTGAGFTPNVYVSGSVDPSWSLVGAFDFNGDGKADLLWRNSNSGTFTIWESTGSGFTPNALVDGSVSNQYNIVMHHYDII